MVNQKISTLPILDAPKHGAYVPVVQDGTLYKMPFENFHVLDAGIIFNSVDEDGYPTNITLGLPHKYIPLNFFSAISYMNLGKSLVSLNAFGGKNEVYQIANGSFYKCEALETIDFLIDANSAATSGFYYCTSLREVRFDAPPTRLYDNMFYACRSLQSIDSLDALTTVGQSALYGCTVLEGDIDLSKLTSVSSYAFTGCTKLRFHGNYNLVSVPYGLFSDCQGLDEISLPNCTSTQSTAFTRSGVHKVTAPKLTSLGASAFYGLKSDAVKEFYFPALSLVGQYAFSKCKNIGNLSLPAAKTIEAGAFESVTNGNITLGSAGNPVQLIQSSAFNFVSANSGITLTIYTADGQALPGHPYGSSGIPITYMEA